ncbi:zinc metalloprotease [Actibacterium mucosum KCTC 23349]|uniref:Zinc metalloprotease n=2 Tax=Actibacterium TaxID=1433986 RepID=A0A037ZLB0_9RHOB|nr:zinc metalloprotease [Actibacterium mucosum KCTC 23349]
MDSLPDIGTMLYNGVFFVIALSVVVFVHEMGHYLVGRWTGIRAEVFSIGFGKTLISGYDRHGTKWQVAMIPLGGYVKFLGDSDAASGKDAEFMGELDEETLRHTMHGAPLYARALTVAAGPVFNFVLSIIVFAALMMVQGEVANPPTVGKLSNIPYGAVDLQPGDRILQIDGTETPDYEAIGDLADTLPSSPSVSYVIERDGQQQTIEGPYPFPARISLVQPQSAAFDAGLKLGDYVTAIDGNPIIGFGDVVDTVRDTKDKSLDLSVWRDGEELNFTLTPRLSDVPLNEGGFEQRWLIGMTGGGLFFEPARQQPSIIDATLNGIDSTFGVLTGSLSMLYHVAVGDISTCNVRGILTIAETSGATAVQGIVYFVSFIAMLSAAIGMVNLFPIPVLDGGHLVFHFYEAIAGKPPSDRVLNVMMSVGIVLVLGLMLFALGNDIFCR